MKIWNPFDSHRTRLASEKFKTELRKRTGGFELRNPELNETHEIHRESGPSAVQNGKAIQMRMITATIIDPPNGVVQ